MLDRRLSPLSVVDSEGHGRGHEEVLRKSTERSEVPRQIVKQAIMITIDDPSRNKVKDTTDEFMKALTDKRGSLQNGVGIRISLYNPDFSEDENSHLGKFARWFLNETKRVSKEMWKGT